VKLGRVSRLRHLWQVLNLSSAGSLKAVIAAYLQTDGNQLPPRRHGQSRQFSSPYGMVITTFPICWFDSRYLYASIVSAKEKVFAILGTNRPSASRS
jgi:hypothetical protein